LGYIRQGKIVHDDQALPVYRVEEFVEKPAMEEAQKMVERWEFLWNTGYKVVHLPFFLQTQREAAPELIPAMDATATALSNPESLADAYALFPTISIEHCFTPHVQNPRAVPPGLRGVVLGGRPTSREMGRATCLAQEGPGMSKDAQQSFVLAQSKPVITLGLRNTAVIDCPDCVVVLQYDSLDHLKELVAKVVEQYPELA